MNYFNDDLFREVISTNNPIGFFNTNKNKFQSNNLKEHLYYLLQTKGIPKSKIIYESSINTTYAYHIFSGEKRPSRNKVLAISFAFKLNLAETQCLLRHAEVMELSIMDFRDAAIIYGIVNRYSLMKTNGLLHDVGALIID